MLHNVSKLVSEPFSTYLVLHVSSFSGSFRVRLSINLPLVCSPFHTHSTVAHLNPKHDFSAAYGAYERSDDRE